MIVYFPFLAIGRLIFKTFLVGNLFSLEMRNVNVWSKGGRSLPPFFVLDRDARFLGFRFRNLGLVAAA